MDVRIEVLVIMNCLINPRQIIISWSFDERITAGNLVDLRSVIFAHTHGSPSPVANSPADVHPQVACDVQNDCVVSSWSLWYGCQENSTLESTMATVAGTYPSEMGTVKSGRSWSQTGDFPASHV